MHATSTTANEISRNCNCERREYLAAEYSQTFSRFPLGLAAVERVMGLNNPRKADRWRSLTVGGHLWHAFKHICLYFVGDLREPHISHAATRLLMAAQLAAARRDRGTHLPAQVRTR